MWSAYIPAIFGLLAIILYLVQGTGGENASFRIAPVAAFTLLYFGLGYGIYRRSRTCAILALLLVLSTLAGTLRIKSFITIPLALLLYGIVRGIRGTFAHHRRGAGRPLGNI